MSITFPGESPQYRAARDRLLEQEIEQRRAMEAVAHARRRLPPGGVVPQDYVFQGAGPDGAPTEVRLSELFDSGKDSLVIYNFMFPRSYGGERPGPASGEARLIRTGTRLVFRRTLPKPDRGLLCCRSRRVPAHPASRFSISSTAP